MDVPPLRDTELFETKTARLNFALDQNIAESIHVGAAVLSKFIVHFWAIH